jgi:hypothetical protein
MTDDNDWVKLRVQREGFRKPEYFDGPHRIVILKTGGLSVPSIEPRVPEIVDAFTSLTIPYEGMRIRLDDRHFYVLGIEFRIDLECFVVLVSDNPGTPALSLPRYFKDLSRVQF